MTCPRKLLTTQTTKGFSGNSFRRLWPRLRRSVYVMVQPLFDECE